VINERAALTFDIVDGLEDATQLSLIIAGLLLSRLQGFFAFSMSSMIHLRKLSASAATAASHP